MKTNYKGNKLFTLIARSYNAAKAIIMPVEFKRQLSDWTLF